MAVGAVILNSRRPARGKLVVFFRGFRHDCGCHSRARCQDRRDHSTWWVDRRDIRWSRGWPRDCSSGLRFHRLNGIGSPGLHLRRYSGLRPCATIACERTSEPGPAAFVFWLLAVSWVRLCDSDAWVGWILMALVLSLWWPAFLALCRWAVFRLRIPLDRWPRRSSGSAWSISAPTSSPGFPWYYLGHSQSRFLYVIQIADITGALGVSLVIALVNVFIVDVLTLPLFHHTKRGSRLTARQEVRLCLVTILLGTTLCYGAFRVSHAEFRNGPRLALLQSNIEQSHKMVGDPFEILGEFEKLVKRALSVKDRPDLIVWPETAYPFGFITIDSGVDAKSLESQVAFDTHNEEALGFGLARPSEKT